MKPAVYKSEESHHTMMALYDEQVLSLNIDCEDVYVDTRFGLTHLLKTGNPNGKPIVLFHGGNSTAPYYLRDFLFLRKDYLIFAPDTMGHPGKSAQNILSPQNMEYGKWAADVIEGLGLEKVICMGGSYGGGILVKLMCVAPGKIAKAVLLVPSGIRNVSIPGIMVKLGIPTALYIATKSEKQLKKTILQMAIDECEIDEGTKDMVRCTFNNIRIKAGMPSNVRTKDIAGYKSPTLLVAGERDILFPGKKVIARAKKIIPDLRTHLMEGCGHMSNLSLEKHKDVIELIEEFLKL